jgi:hypothetical protein
LPLEIDEETYYKVIHAEKTPEFEFRVATRDSAVRDCIMYPTNKNLIRFNFLTSTLVFYDCFMVPFKNTYGSKIFDQSTERALLVIDNSIKLIFTIDVVLGFRKAYLGDDGQIVRDPVKITKRYLRFYFWVDLLSAIPFDNFVDSGLLRYISLIKVFRLYRFQ